jgi:hypothetical protein
MEMSKNDVNMKKGKILTKITNLDSMGLKRRKTLAEQESL